MTALARRFATILIVILAWALPAGGAWAADDSDNIATAVTEQDGSHVFDFAWDINKRRSNADVKDLNKAMAGARCTDCGATAIAFQIVLVSGSPEVVAPINQAIALNYECTGCGSTAEAYQFVRVMPERVRFTGTGRAILDDVRDQLEALNDPSLTPLQIHEMVEAQKVRVLDVLNHELVVKSDPDASPDFLERRLFRDADTG